MPKHEHLTETVDRATQEPVDIAVLDTNVFLKDPYAALTIRAKKIIVPFSVLEELDTLKAMHGATGKHARETIHFFEALRLTGDLNAGVPLSNKPDAPQLQVIHTESFLLDDNDPDMISSITEQTSADDMVIYTANYYHNKGQKTLLCTQDLNMRVKASLKGIDSKEYERKQTGSDLRTSIDTVAHVTIPAKLLKELTNSRVHQICDASSMRQNQFVVAQSENNPENFRIFRYNGGTQFSEVGNKPILGPFSAQNIEQQMAADLLLDDNIQLVSLIGIAGTGKTFLILLAALRKILHEHVYSRILVTRPTISLGPDIGFLPGDMGEKLETWMQPVYDNISVIVKEIKNKKYPLHISAEKLLENDQLSLQAMTYMRGRSLPKQFVFVDEAQNLTPLEIKTLISRAGAGTKVVLAGDPEQIDNPKLTYENNGLMLATRRFYGQSIFGCVMLHKSERSILAQKAAELL